MSFKRQVQPRSVSLDHIGRARTSDGRRHLRLGCAALLVVTLFAGIARAGEPRFPGLTTARGYTRRLIRKLDPVAAAFDRFETQFPNPTATRPQQRLLDRIANRVAETPLGHSDLLRKASAPVVEAALCKAFDDAIPLEVAQHRGPYAVEFRAILRKFCVERVRDLDAAAIARIATETAHSGKAGAIRALVAAMGSPFFAKAIQGAAEKRKGVDPRVTQLLTEYRHNAPSIGEEPTESDVRQTLDPTWRVKQIEPVNRGSIANVYRVELQTPISELVGTQYDPRFVAVVVPHKGMADLVQRDRRALLRSHEMRNGSPIVREAIEQMLGFVELEASGAATESAMAHAAASINAWGLADEVSVPPLLRRSQHGSVLAWAPGVHASELDLKSRERTASLVAKIFFASLATRDSDGTCWVNCDIHPSNLKVDVRDGRLRRVHWLDHPLSIPLTEQQIAGVVGFVGATALPLGGQQQRARDAARHIRQFVSQPRGRSVDPDALAQLIEQQLHHGGLTATKESLLAIGGAEGLTLDTNIAAFGRALSVMMHSVGELVDENPARKAAALLSARSMISSAIRGSGMTRNYRVRDATAQAPPGAPSASEDEAGETGPRRPILREQAPSAPREPDLRAPRQVPRQEFADALRLEAKLSETRKDLGAKQMAGAAPDAIALLKTRVERLEQAIERLPRRAVEAARFRVFLAVLRDLEGQKGTRGAISLLRRAYYDGGLWVTASGQPELSREQKNALGAPQGRANPRLLGGGEGDNRELKVVVPDGTRTDIAHVLAGLDYQLNRWPRRIGVRGREVRNPVDERTLGLSGDLMTAAMYVGSLRNLLRQGPRAAVRHAIREQEGNADFRGDVDMVNVLAMLSAEPQAGAADLLESYYLNSGNPPSLRRMELFARNASSYFHRVGPVLIPRPSAGLKLLQDALAAAVVKRDPDLIRRAIAGIPLAGAGFARWHQRELAGKNGLD
jgi:hypothetical protein